MRTPADPQPAPGAFYTPAPIVDSLVRQTFGALADGGPAADEPTILDPACGDGALLLGAYGRLLRWHRARYAAAPEHHAGRLCRDGRGGWRLTLAERRRILQQQIHGVDIDAGAVAAARAALWRAMLQGEDGPPAPELDGNIICGNALISDDIGLAGAALLRANPLNWRRAFPAIMGAGGFAVVLGNPPWVSLSGRFGRAVLSPAERDYLAARYPGHAAPNLFVYFVALGLELTGEGGLLSLLVPDRLGFNRQLAPLRARLLRETELLALRYGQRFPGVVADTLAFTLRRRRPTEASTTLVACADGPPLARPQREFLAHSGYAFTCDADAPAQALADRLARLPHVAPLGALFASASGFGGRAQLIHGAPAHPGETMALKGDSIGRYALRKVYWFAFARANLTGRTSDRRKLAASPRLLLRKTGDRLIATYDEGAALPEQSLYFLYDKRSPLSHHFFLGVLNARLLTWYLRARALTNRSSMAQIKKVDLDRLPLPAFAQDDRRYSALHDRIAGLAGQLLELHARPPGAAGDAGTRQQIAQADHQIDQLVYALYGLSPAEIALVEQA